MVLLPNYKAAAMRRVFYNCRKGCQPFTGLFLFSSSFRKVGNAKICGNFKFMNKTAISNLL